MACCNFEFCPTIGIKDGMEMFIPIWPFSLPTWLIIFQSPCLSILLSHFLVDNMFWICVFHQESGNKNFNCCINEMHTLIIHQCEWASKFNKDKFIDEFGCDHNCIDPKCFGFHPFDNIIDYDQNISFFGRPTNRLD